MARAVIVWVLLSIAALLTLACSVGVAVMRDPLQRLHFVAPPTTISAALVTAALFVDGADDEAAAKSVLVTIVLALMNGVATHATARAARVRQSGTWLPVAGERIAVRGDGVLEGGHEPERAGEGR